MKMNKNTNGFLSTATLLGLGLAGTSTPAIAEVSVMEEIVVSARKREESLQDIPIIVTAFTKAQIDSYAINSINDLSAMVPGFLATDTSSSAPQGIIGLRGISTGATATGSDQAVAINIDGVQIEHANGLRAGQIDLDQIEILKGPQALFFGKNNSGGVVALKTADPTEENFVHVRIGHEFNAEEKFGEIIVSGPINDTLGARGVLYSTSVDGWFKNEAVNPVADRTAPDYDELIGRLTFLWTPNDAFTARVKITRSEKNSDHRATSQKIFCNVPTAETGDCKKDDVIVIADPQNDFGGHTNTREPFFDSDLTIGSLELDYQVSDNFNINSVTGFYEINQTYFGNIVPTDIQSDPVFGTFSLEALREGKETIKSLSQEIRVTSTFDGPMNFMVGVFADDRNIELGGDFSLSFISFEELEQKIESDAISVFAQGIWDVSDKWEIAGGLRWTEEKKKYSGVLLEAVIDAADGSDLAPPGTLLIPMYDEIKNSNVSPELTITWKPTEDISLFVAYKEGFKSGSFDASATSNDVLAVNQGEQDISFKPEEVIGGEIGLKSTLLDGTLRLNIAAYSYDYTNLQLSSFDPKTITTRIINAGAADVKGLEIESQWNPSSITGLTLNGAISFNNAEYSDFITDCNQSQLTSGTCSLDIKPDATNSPDSQNLSGEPLNRAPKVSATAGFAFATPLDLGFSDNIHFGLNAVYSDDYLTDARNEPLSQQDSYFLLHGNIGIYSNESGWKLDLIGRNLTDEHYHIVSANLPLTGGGGPQDQMASVMRGRELILQYTIDF